MIIKSAEQYRINFQEDLACASVVQKGTHNHQDLSHLDIYGRYLLKAIDSNMCIINKLINRRIMF